MAMTRGEQHSPAPPDHACLGAETCGPGRTQRRRPARRAPRHPPQAQALLDGEPSTRRIEHTTLINKLPRHVELAPDRARRVEYRRVALRETAPIPVVAAADDGGHRY